MPAALAFSAVRHLCRRWEHCSLRATLRGEGWNLPVGSVLHAPLMVWSLLPSADGPFLHILP